MRSKRFWLTASALSLAVAAGAYYYRSDVAANAPPIATAQVTRGSVVATVEASGTLEAVTTVQVGTQVSGTIKSLYADFNSRVHKGEVIAELDPSLFETQVAQQQATVQRLRADADKAEVESTDAGTKYRRAADLYAKHLLAKSDLDAAESTANAAHAAVKSADAQIVQAEASLNQAKVNLSHTIIRAPIDGVVIARNVDVGQTVAASMQAPTLFVLAQDLREMRVNASVDESDIGKVRPNQPVRFTVDAYPQETFRGTVSQVRLQPVVDQNVVSYVTVIDVANQDLKLKPGMTAGVSIEVARADDVMRVPNAALRFQPDTDVFAKLKQPPPATWDGASNQPSGPPVTRVGETRDAHAVWVFADDRLTRVPVQVGLSDGKETEVTGDVASGARVATAILSSDDTSPAVTTRSPFFPQRRGGGRRS